MITKLGLSLFRGECQQAVENVKSTYLTNLGNKVNDPNTSQKSYWKIINRVMNKCRTPKIPKKQKKSITFFRTSIGL